mgnify:CR=1 FL=1
MRHVTFHAISPFCAHLMKMVPRIIKTGRVFFIWGMAAGAKLIIVMMQLGGMGIMATGTLYPLMKHLALNIRAVNIDLIVNLTIYMVSRNLHLR